MGDANTGSGNTRRAESLAVTATLVLRAGEGVPSRIELSGNTLTFGRGMNNDIVCTGLQISRKHAAFHYTDNKWFLKDMSTNGLSVNGHKVSKIEPTELSDQDMIMFIPTGALVYKFEYIHSPASSSNSITNSGSVTGGNRNGEVVPKRNDNGVSNFSIELIVDENSNHSESLLNDEDIIDYPMPALPANEPTTATTTASVNAPLKRRHDAILNEKVKEKSSSKKKLIQKKDEYFKIDESEDLPDVDPLRKEEENEDLPDIEELVTIPAPRKKLLNAGDIMKCNDIVLLRKELAECVENMQTQDAKYQIEVFESEIRYQKLLDKYNDFDSKMEVQREEIFKLLLETMERELGCCICNEIFIQATVIDCGHTFCNFCICEWSRRNPDCPICRASIKIKSKHNEIENYIVIVHTLMSDEIQKKRELAIQERQKSIEKAQIDQVASARGRRGAITDITGRGISEFLANDMFLQQRLREAAVANANRGRSRGARGASGRRGARIQGVIDDVAAYVPPTMSSTARRARGRAGRTRASRVPIPLMAEAATSSSSSTAAGTNAISTGDLNFASNSRPGPSGFMGLLGMVATAASGRVPGINFFTSASTSSAVPSAVQDGITVPLNFSTENVVIAGAGPRLSESVVLLSSDDDVDLTDQGRSRRSLRAGRRLRAISPIPINVDLLGSSISSDSSDDSHY